MKKSTSLKKLSLKKLMISRLTHSGMMIEGGSGICGGTKSEPVHDCPSKSVFNTNCKLCNPTSDQVNGC